MDPVERANVLQTRKFPWRYGQAIVNLWDNGEIQLVLDPDDTDIPRLRVVLTGDMLAFINSLQDEAWRKSREK